jgi:hypothetical protein
MLAVIEIGHALSAKIYSISGLAKRNTLGLGLSDKNWSLIFYSIHLREKRTVNPISFNNYENMKYTFRRAFKIGSGSS